MKKRFLDYFKGLMVLIGLALMVLFSAALYYEMSNDVPGTALMQSIDNNSNIVGFIFGGIGMIYIGLKKN